jgi:hypothetical protein
MTTPGAAPAKKAKGSPVRVPAAWNSLATHKKEMGPFARLVCQRPGRADRFRLEAAGLFLDYSKNRITDKTIKGHDSSTNQLIRRYRAINSN